LSAAAPPRLDEPALTRAPSSRNSVPMMRPSLLSEAIVTSR
jgi:hypothetical protein